MVSVATVKTSEIARCKGSTIKVTVRLVVQGGAPPTFVVVVLVVLYRILDLLSSERTGQSQTTVSVKSAKSLCGDCSECCNGGYRVWDLCKNCGGSDPKGEMLEKRLKAHTYAVCGNLMVNKAQQVSGMSTT